MAKQFPNRYYCGEFEMNSSKVPDAHDCDDYDECDGNCCRCSNSVHISKIQYLNKCQYCDMMKNCGECIEEFIYN